MKKQDLLPVVIIFALILAYPEIDRRLVRKIFPGKPVPTRVSEQAPDRSTPEDAAFAATEDTTPSPTAATQPTTEAPQAAPVAAMPEEPATPPVVTVLENELLRLSLTSHGAGIASATIKGYPISQGTDECVTYDFSDRPAAAPTGYAGLPPAAAFEVVAATSNSVTYRKTLHTGLTLQRTLTLGAHYQIKIAEQLTNTSDATLATHGQGIQAGFMHNLPGESQLRQGPTLGVDTLTGSAGVRYWGAKLDKWFPPNGNRASQTIPGPNAEPDPVDWVAVKNKYFTQILTPDVPAKQCATTAEHGPAVHSSFLGLFPKTTIPIARVAAGLTYPGVDINPGQTITRNTTFYIGPKVYNLLKANGPHQEDVLQLGFWRPIGIGILKIMVWFHDHVWPYNYGLAIILLTFLIRAIFWPLNHKSMVSTRQMQAIQPLITAAREKYKDNPQRQQQEMMALYKEHKINPMGGCLPMLIQIPVFFALFVVLRGAIELRFSSFLWIRDLSTPENLLRDVLPFPINILPIFMGVTMWLQQRMTPTADPQQQRMMMLMPILFTFMFYSFPSGLSLYWSINQVLMIIQLAWMKKRHPTPAPAPAK